MVYSAFQRKAPQIIGGHDARAFITLAHVCLTFLQRATKLHRPWTQLNPLGNTLRKSNLERPSFVTAALYPGKFHTCTSVLVWQFQPVARLERMGLHYWWRRDGDQHKLRYRFPLHFISLVSRTFLIGWDCPHLWIALTNSRFNRIGS